MIGVRGYRGDLCIGPPRANALDAEEVRPVVARRCDNELDFGMNAHPFPEVAVEGVAKDDVPPSGLVKGHLVRLAVDADDWPAALLDELVVRAGTDPTHPEYENIGSADVDDRVIGEVWTSLQPGGPRVPTLVDPLSDGVRGRSDDERPGHGDGEHGEPLLIEPAVVHSRGDDDETELAERRQRQRGVQRRASSEVEAGQEEEHG